MADDEGQAAGLARRPAWLTAVGAVALFTVLAAVLVPWSWVPGGSLTPVDPESIFSAAELDRAADYSGPARIIGLSSHAVSLLVALVLAFTPAGARLARRLPLTGRWWTAVPLGVLALLLIGRVATLPFALVSRSRRLDYGLTNQGIGGWLVDLVTGVLVDWVAWSVVLLVIVGLARRSPRWWFAWAGGVSAVLVVLGSFLYPVVVEPLFNKFEPLAAGDFRDSVFALAEREGVLIDEVLVADASRRTTTLNAYVSGFGGTRRLVVYDNLLSELDPAEARVVIAHELAHAQQNDVVVGTLLGAVAAAGGVALLALLLDSRRLRTRSGVAGAADPAVVALVLGLVAVGTFVASPVQNSISRAIEARADRVSIVATGEDQVFVRMQHELTVRSLSDPDPPALTQFWFGSHPTTVQRAGLPDSLRRADG